MRSTVPSGRDADGSDDGKVVKEMERLALVSSESLDDLRHRLLVYRAGDLWFPAGGIPKQETDIPLVITVLLLGFAGSGKSSLVNLMYSVLGRAEIVPFAHTSSPAASPHPMTWIIARRTSRLTRRLPSSSPLNPTPWKPTLRICC